MNISRIGKRAWASLVLVGLVGQFAWTIENMYFNVFLYNTISTDPDAIAAMVAASAASATLTTLLVGALSDRLAKRKLFISGGYILWGLSTLSFGFISVENAAALFPAANAVAMATGMVIAMDCLMTVFGSTANDAAFNAYVTDITDETNRGKAESVLATLPLLSTLIVFGAFDGMTRAGRWQEFFLIFGLMVTLTGAVSIFLVKEPPLVKKNEPYFANILYGFRPSVVRENRLLYTALAAFGVFSIAVQIYMPYLIIYMQNYLKIEAYAIILGVVLLFASLVSVLSGGLLDKLGRLNCVLPALGLMFAGLLLMYIARTFAFVIVAGCVMMSGFMLVTAILSATVRDHTPQGKVGMFQGIRMIFVVLLPMVIGPFIGSAVIKGSAETYVDLGVVKNVPTPGIFLAAAIALLVSVIPVIILKRGKKV